ncbi:MAG TPA: amidase [Stellaceae bacterium]|nr:amidase [Stellaceae bacterium]
MPTLEMLSFSDAAPGFAAGKSSPRELLETGLENLARFEPGVGAFVGLDVGGARAAADRASLRWREGRELSPIDGMPVGVQDIIETVDLPTQMGSPLYAGWRSGRDAASARALREAGAAVLGKTVTTEFAASEPLGDTRNPWDLRRTPGGSSSGSAAAVAYGALSGALGTQVVGSIIRPASFCGCFGFKPSVGGINRGGSHDYFSQSCTGVLAASLADAWRLAREIARRSGGDPGFPGLAGPAAPPPPRRPARLAIIETAGWERASPAARDAFEAAVGRLAAAGIGVARRGEDAGIAAVEAAVANAFELTRGINAWEGRWPLNTYRERDAAKLSRAMLDRLVAAEAMRQEDYAALIAERARARGVFEGLAGNFDAALTLSATGAAPLGLASTGDPIFAVPASLLGVPALSLPLLEAEGLPLGLQAVGFIGADAALFAVAAALVEVLEG